MTYFRIINQNNHEFMKSGIAPKLFRASILGNKFWYYNTKILLLALFFLYKNPADDICTAEVDASVEGEKIIYVYNTMGHLIEVYPFDPMETSVEMEVEGLTQGIYIILLYADSVFVESKLLSVQHPWCRELFPYL